VSNQTWYNTANPLAAPVFDEVWCVFDVEKQGTNPTLEQAVSKANSENIQLAVSNPVFEYWFLLHYAEFNRAFTDYNDVEKELKKYIANYQKNMDVCRKIFDDTKDAIERARKVLNNHPDKDNSFPNPSTGVSELVDKLISMVSH
jgi:hypothetical protein